MRLVYLVVGASLCIAGCSRTEPSIHWQAGVPYCGTEVAGADESAAAHGAYDVAICPDKFPESENLPGSH